MTPELSVLKDGTILRDEHGNVLDASSSVVLVRSKGTVLVVDTAMPRDADTIRTALDDRGLGPEDVDVVVNTHGHIDHTGCNRLFTRATVAVHATEGAYRAGGGDVLRLEEGSRLAEGIWVMETPGHTRGHISVVVELPGETWVAAGDALPTQDNYLKWVPPRINYDPDVALGSMAKIARVAQVVVPGHGSPFKLGGDRP